MFVTASAPAQFSITFLTPLGLTAEEARDARKRAEAEARATEAAVKLQEQREFLERRRLREEKMAEWVRVYRFELIIERIMEIGKSNATRLVDNSFRVKTAHPRRMTTLSNSN